MGRTLRLVVITIVAQVGLADAANHCTPDDPSSSGMLQQCTAVTTGLTAGRWPAAGCCSATAFDNSCSAAAPALTGDRKNVVMIILDDQGYCQHGSMQGRCAQRRRPCGGKSCEGAPWIDCTADADCPAGCGETAGACIDAPNSGCDDGETCTNGYCSECADDDDCDHLDICIEGLCSPRASCMVSDGETSTDMGDYVCARGMGTCLNDDHPGDGNSTGTCRTKQHAACDVDSDCNDFCGDMCEANICTLSGDACETTEDCRNDQTAYRLCQRTPSACYSNDDCPAQTTNTETCGENGRCTSGGVETDGGAPCNVDADCNAYVCTTSEHPLRLNDASCRYRQPGSSKWPYDRSTAPVDLPNLPPGGRTVWTPQMDALAEGAAVFPYARSGGQVCYPARGVLTYGRLLRHRGDASRNEPNQCKQDLRAVIDQPLRCGTSCPATCSSLPGSCASCGGTEACVATGGSCEKAHNLAWWFTNQATALGGGLPARTIAVGKSHINIGFSGQGYDFCTNDNDANPAIARFNCDSTSSVSEIANCPATLRQGGLPTVVTSSDTNSQIATSSLHEVIADIRAQNGDRPFFVHYAPRLPHPESVNATPFFRALSNSNVEGDEDTMAGVAYTDAGIEGLVDELKRTCICAGNGQSDSLFDHTVFVIVNDQGWLMPAAKQGGDGATENAHRETMIISTPELRARRRLVTNQAAPPGAEPSTLHLDGHSHFAGDHDVLPTVLAHSWGEDACLAGRCTITRLTCANDATCSAVVAGDVCLDGTCVAARKACSGATDCPCTDATCVSAYVDRVDDSPINIPLRPYTEPDHPKEFLRTYYGHSGETGDLDGVPDNAEMYVVPRPGILGLCTAGTIGSPPHKKVCYSNTDCSSGTCLKFTGTSGPYPWARRCLNRPDLQCTSDAACGVGLCNPGTGTCRRSSCTGGTCSVSGIACSHDAHCGSFVDFEGLACTTDGDCVPEKVCVPPMIKVEMKAGDVKGIYDLNCGPDEAVSGGGPGCKNLASSNYLGTEFTDPATQCCTPTTRTAAQTLQCCMQEFFELDDDGVWRPKDYGCPAELREWTPVQPGCP